MRSIASSSSASQRSQSTIADAVLGERGPHPLARTARDWRAPSSVHALRDAVDRLRRREAVGAARVDAGVHLVVQAGHAHHVELVQVGGVDRQELDALEQRRSLVLGQREHALVEVEPGQLAVHVELARESRSTAASRRLAPRMAPSRSSIVTRVVAPGNVRHVIWLLRHGEAADGSPDAERPLTEKGEEQSRAAGAALAALGVELDACLASPKVRAADTARLACEQLEGVEVAARAQAGRRAVRRRVAGGGPRRRTCCWWATIPTSRWPCTR